MKLVLFIFLVLTPTCGIGMEMPMFSTTAIFREVDALSNLKRFASLTVEHKQALCNLLQGMSNDQLGIIFQDVFKGMSADQQRKLREEFVALNKTSLLSRVDAQIQEYENMREQALAFRKAPFIALLTSYFS